jgi:acyl-CoA synthetase (NDP forming)
MADAREMIGELKGYRMLQGVLGDIDALADILCRLFHLALELCEEIAEIDINPLRVFEKGQGAVALDCLMKLRSRRDED